MITRKALMLGARFARSAFVVGPPTLLDGMRRLFPTLFGGPMSQLRLEAYRRGERLAHELEIELRTRLAGCTDPQVTLDAFVGDLRALGHSLRVDDSDTGQRLWADESRWLAIWVHGAVAPDGTVLRVDRVEVLWQKL